MVTVYFYFNEEGYHSFHPTEKAASVAQKKYEEKYSDRNGFIIERNFNNKEMLEHFVCDEISDIEWSLYTLSEK